MSRWRQNVADLGAVGLPEQWLAHVLGVLNPHVYFDKFPGVESGTLWEINPSLGIWSILANVGPSPGFPKWPFAFTVEPDRP